MHYDFDDIADDGAPEFTFKLAGEEFKGRVPAFGEMVFMMTQVDMATDPFAQGRLVVDMLCDCVEQGDRERLMKAVRTVRSPERFLQIMRVIIEQVTDRPTQPPASSPA